MGTWPNTLLPVAGSMERYGADDEIGLVDFVLHGLLRVTTITRFFTEPSQVADGVHLIERLDTATNPQRLFGSPATWPIFEGLIRAIPATGNDIPDAYLAALAIEHDAVLCSADRGFGRFPGLRHLNPLESS